MGHSARWQCPRSVIQNPEGSTRAACNATIMAAQDEFNRKLAQPVAPAQPPPQQAEQKAAFRPSNSLLPLLSSGPGGYL